MNGTTAVAIPEKWKKDIQQYDEKKYLILAPIELGPIPAMHTPMASVVKIDPEPANGDVYSLQGKFAYSKAALDRVAGAAGISWLPEMCGRTDAGTDPEVVRFRMAAKRKELDGQWRVVVREYEFDLKAREEELKETVPKRQAIAEITDKAKKDKAIADAVAKDMIQLRKFKVQRAESGAANRVIRVFLGIKANYTREQIARPMIVPKLVFTPDYSDPEVKRFMLAEATGTIPELYGAQASAGTFANPIVVHETVAELEDDKRPALPPAPEGTGTPGAGNGEGANQPSTSEPPPPPDCILQFTEAYAQEQAAGSDEVKYAAVADQIAALEVLMARKGYDKAKLQKPLAQFSRDHRKRFFDHLQAMPDVEQQPALPWG